MISLLLLISLNIFHNIFYITLSWRRSLSKRNQSIDLQSKSMDWFLYNNGLRHERLKQLGSNYYRISKFSPSFFQGQDIQVSVKVNIFKGLTKHFNRDVVIFSKIIWYNWNKYKTKLDFRALIGLKLQIKN